MYLINLNIHVLAITHGRIRACAIHETTVYSGKKKILRGTMRTRTVRELQGRKSRASFHACFLVLKFGKRSELGGFQISHLHRQHQGK